MQIVNDIIERSIIQSLLSRILNIPCIGIHATSCSMKVVHSAALFSDLFNFQIHLSNRLLALFSLQEFKKLHCTFSESWPSK